MGVDTRKPLLPAPTESSMVDATGDSATPTDLATDISRRTDKTDKTDKTSYSIPDDGSPITISTRERSHQRPDQKITRGSHHSQTSLLIEYFEGGKGPNLNSRPSVRVKVTPSSARKARERDDHIQISEAGGNRKPSYSRRISLGTPGRTRQLQESGTDDRSISSLNTGEDPNQTGRRPPLEIEFVNRDQGSELSNFSNARYIQPTSDISSMPPESALDITPTLQSKRSRSLDRETMYDSNNTLKAPSRRRSRSLSRERIAYKAAEKLSGAPREVSSNKSKRHERTRNRNASKEMLDSEVKSPRRRSAKHRDDDLASPESSLLTNSALSSQGKAGDRNSFRSGTSKSSINNPKLLETVEDAIRRLILPELSELKKDQKTYTNRSKFERDTARSRDPEPKTGLARSLSKHASAPDVTTPRVVLNEDSNDSGSPLEEQPKRRRDRRGEKDSESHSRKVSKELTVPDDNLQRKKSKGLRDAEAAGIVGHTLTAAALRHHDSNSSLDKSTRGTRRSSSRNEVPQINETEVIFQKHAVPLMPMRSEIDSELTRESLLSQRTAETTTPRESPPIHEVSRGSPGSSTPTRKSLGQKGLGTRHSNLSNQNLSARGSPSDRSLRENSRSPLVTASPNGAVTASDHLNYQLDQVDEDRGYSGYANHRGLSPIQSVASYKDDASDIGHDTRRELGSSESLSSANKGAINVDQRLSIDSLSSAPSTSLARSKRPNGVAVETEDQAVNRNGAHDEVGYSEGDNWQEYDTNDKEEDSYRYSYEEGDDASDPKVDIKRMTNYTEDSLDEPYLDRVAAGQQVADGYAASPEYVHTPIAVESAIASLHEPSVLDSKSVHSGKHSYSESLNRPQSTRELSVNGGGSPLKQRQDAASPEEKSFPQRMGATSPPQSVAESLDDEEAEEPRMGATGLPGAGSPIPEIGHIPDSGDSDINTNPSIIQGPIGGVSHENRDHWPYKPTPPRSTGNQMSPQPENGGTRGLLDGGDIDQHDDYEQPYYDQGYDQAYGSKDVHGMDPSQMPYMTGHMVTTPPGAKDEGYISAANPRSPSVATTDPKNRGFGGIDNNAPRIFDSPSVDDDPFTGSHKRHLSGYSHGMESPLYDSATGRGIDRIQSKDIVALMDHVGFFVPISLIHSVLTFLFSSPFETLSVMRETRKFSSLW